MIRAVITGPTASQKKAFEQFATQALERAALRASDRAARQANEQIRTAMASAKLGRLGFAIGVTSDLEKRGRVHRPGGKGFSASGAIFIKSKSPRTAGALKAYTEGAPRITAKKGWLWIPTKDLQRRVRMGKSNYRMTLARYLSEGFVERIGPLVELPGRDGERLLAVENVSLNRKGKPGSVRRLPRRGRVGPTREVRQLVILFVGIRSTSRAARVNVQKIIAANAARLPSLIAEEL